MVLRVESSVNLCSFFMGLSLILELFVCELDPLLYSWVFFTTNYLLPFYSRAVKHVFSSYVYVFV